MKQNKSPFKWRHFEPSLILLCVRWYCRASLKKADLSGAKLYHTDFVGADLSRVDFSDANLSWAHLTRANLSDANLRGAHLWFVELVDTTLNDTDLSGASLYWAKLGYLDLSRAKGLDRIKHRGPSLIGVDSIIRSKGKIPELFLRGVGLPDIFITFSKSLIEEAVITFYSCFISYSSSDKNFTRKLYADLQDKGVRCWFAPEDLKIGDRFRDRIDESIRLHDKLLLILSENSVSSQWVGDEVEAAFERERREGRTVLFPIRIDDAVMESDKAWAATIRRTRHVGDFTRWEEEHDSYSKAFGRLLRDLKAGA